MRFRVSLYLSAAVLGLSSMGTAAASDHWPSSLTIGTASVGGTYYVYGGGLGALISDETGVTADAEVTGGPFQNAPLLQAGDIDIALVTMGPAYEAWIGESEIAPGVEHTDMRALFPMFQTPFHAVALGDSGIAGMADLDGRRVGVGPAGSTGGGYFPRTFEILGLDVEPQFGGGSDLGSQVRDGLIDAFAFAAGAPIPAFAEVEAQTDAVIFSYNQDQIETLLAELPYMAEGTIPADAYTSLSEDLATVVMWNFAVGHRDLPEDLAYEIVKAVHENHDRMMTVHATAAETVPENAVHNDFVYWHPGAIRYYSEIGIDIPEDLYPPEYEN